MSAAGHLAGRVVLVTRPEDRAQSLRSELEALGARVETRPTIALTLPDDLEAPRRALIRLSEYDWVLFTSVNYLTDSFRYRRFLRKNKGSDGYRSTPSCRWRPREHAGGCS